MNLPDPHSAKQHIEREYRDLISVEMLVSVPQTHLSLIFNRCDIQWRLKNITSTLPGRPGQFLTTFFYAKSRISTKIETSIRKISQKKHVCAPCSSLIFNRCDIQWRLKNITLPGRPGQFLTTFFYAKSRISTKIETSIRKISKRNMYVHLVVKA